MDYALQMLLPILLGIYVGHLLDEKTGYAPWYTLGGLILGVVIGIGSLYKRALINQKQLEESRREAKRSQALSSEKPPEEPQ